MEAERDDRIWLQWAIQLPAMGMAGKMVSFKEYKDTVTGANIDRRPVEEILAELDDIEKQFQEGGVDNGT